MVLLEFIVSVSLASLLVAGLLVRWIMARDPGTPKMREIADAIRQGAQAYLGRQYRTISIIAVVFAIVFAIVIRDPGNPWLGVETAGGFIVGALCSNLAGYIAMYISVRSNVRTANASMSGLDPALKVAFRGGMVFGLSVVAMSLIGIAGLFVLFNVVLGIPTEDVPTLMVGFGFGASFAALFAQLGGGIYTKAADMSADLVGKVEAGIPEDDPRNPAVVADLVGDNVGDIAGRGADLFESITGENIGAMILGAGLLAFAASIPGYDILNWVLFPLVARAFGLLAAMVGMFFVYAKEKQDPFKSLTRGLLVTAALAMLGFLGLTIALLGTPANPFEHISLFFAALTGIVAAILITWITSYYTSYARKPVQEIANAAESGPAPGIATGLAVGMESTGLFVLVIGGAILVSFVLGAGLDALVNPVGNAARVGLGIYATAIATMGMLSVTPFILAMDGFGPITDNAAGIVEMSGMPKEQREIGDLMDSAGNTTKALTKGYGVASAALSAFLLFSAFLEVAGLGGVDLAKPSVFVGALVGAMLIFVFSALAVKSVGKTAAIMIQEVRRQFREIKGIMEGTAKPDYSRCVDISTRAALRNMIAPSLLVVLTPIAVGLILGAEAVGALLMIGTVAGIMVALFMNNGGGAMDNAKKYVEAGNLGGKGSPTHAATVIGDTLGDPLKDTAGPSLHVVVKLLNTITLSLAPLFAIFLLKLLAG